MGDKKRVDRPFFHQFLEQLLGYLKVLHPGMHFHSEFLSTQELLLVVTLIPSMVHPPNQVFVTGPFPGSRKINRSLGVSLAILVRDQQ